MMSSFYLDQTSQKQSVGAMALGSFDGVHLGHRALLVEAMGVSQKKGLKSAALCFSPNPKSYFASEEKPFFQIYSLTQNVDEVLSLGIDAVYIKKFDNSCSQMKADGFLDFVFEKVQFEDLVVGFDFKFGKDRSGDHQSLKAWCVKNSVDLHIVNEQSKDEKKISSTHIKKLLQSAKLEEVKALLGRDHYYRGEVRSDQGLGQKIGFPTLNVVLALETAIAHGVYISVLESGGNTYFGLSNIGTRPTVSQTAPNLVLETHILDSTDVQVGPGDKVKVKLKKFIRPEKKFANIEELKSQIAQDVALAQGQATHYNQ